MKKVFLIHGFAGGINELDPLKQFLTSKGFSCYLAYMSGHSNYEKIPPYNVWLSEVYHQFMHVKEQTDQIYIIGFSLGGVLASYLMKTANDFKIKGVVLINAAFNHIYFNNIEIKQLLNEAKNKRVKGGIKFFGSGVINGVKELKKLTDRAKFERWVKYIDKPVMVCNSQLDGVILSNNLEYLYMNIQSEVKIIREYNSNHQIFKSIESQKLYRDILEFIKTYN